MTAHLRMKDGTEYAVDRRLRLHEVAAKINAARAQTVVPLLELQDNATPSRTFYVDPHEVTLAYDDGYSY